MISFIAGMGGTPTRAVAISDSECLVERVVDQTLDATMNGKVNWTNPALDRYETNIVVDSKPTPVVLRRKEGSLDDEYIFSASGMPPLRDNDYAPVARLGQLVTAD
jgi:hypothetical protein